MKARRFGHQAQDLKLDLLRLETQLFNACCQLIRCTATSRASTSDIALYKIAKQVKALTQIEPSSSQHLESAVLETHRHRYDGH